MNDTDILINLTLTLWGHPFIYVEQISGYIKRIENCLCLLQNMSNKIYNINFFKLNLIRLNLKMSF